MLLVGKKHGVRVMVMCSFIFCCFRFFVYEHSDSSAIFALCINTKWTNWTNWKKSKTKHTSSLMTTQLQDFARYWKIPIEECDNWPRKSSIWDNIESVGFVEKKTSHECIWSHWKIFCTVLFWFVSFFTLYLLLNVHSKWKLACSFEFCNPIQILSWINNSKLKTH